MDTRPEIPPHYYIRKRALSLEKKGRKIIHLELGEPDLDTDPRIIEEMYKKALEGYTHYDSVVGIDPLRKRISEYVNSILMLGINKDNIILLPGSKISIFLLSYTLLRDRRRVLMVTPIWGVYIYLVRDMRLDTKLFKLTMDNEWTFSDEQLDNLNELDFDAMILVNPSNPTGGILPKNNIKALTEIAQDKKAYIFADEIYFNLIYGDNKFYSFLQENYENAIGIYSFSKAFAMTGFRLGWMIADKEIIDEVSKKMQLMFTNIPTFIQYAGLKALEMPEIIEENRRIYMRRTYMMADGMKRLGFEFMRPKAGFYIFSKVPPRFGDGFEFSYNLLEETGVTVAPGTTFGDYPEYIRLCTAVSEEKITESLNRIAQFLEKS